VRKRRLSQKSSRRFSLRIFAPPSLAAASWPVAKPGSVDLAPPRRFTMLCSPLTLGGPFHATAS